MAYKISDACVACGTCIVIDPDKCIDCGTCAGVCPSEAISAE